MATGTGRGIWYVACSRARKSTGLHFVCSPGKQKFELTDFNGSPATSKAIETINEEYTRLREVNGRHTAVLAETIGSTDFISEAFLNCDYIPEDIECV